MILGYFRARKGTIYSHNGVITAKNCDELEAEKTQNQIKMGNLNRLLVRTKANSSWKKR